MSTEQTIKLLQEVNSGTQMAVDSIDEILEKVRDKKLADILSKSKADHEQLGDETHALLQNYDDPPKDPGMIAKSMSWLKTNTKLMMDESDRTVADLITDGCNMGIKTIYKHMNDYKDAGENVKKMAKELIRLEEDLRQALGAYL